GEPLKSGALESDAKVSDVAFSPDGAFISAVAGNKVVLWKSDGTPLHEHALEHRDTVRCICFSPDSLRLLTGTADGRVQAWNVLTSGTMGEPIREVGAIVAMEFSRDGKGLLVATHGGVARVWRPAPLHPASDVLPQGAGIEAIAVGPTGHLVTACSDGKARVW